MATKDEIRERLAALREVMRRERLGAFIFPSTDPHNGEYVPERWKGREWISGFNGSAGTAVVTADAAALWTDSRYFIAAAEQTEGTEFELMRERMEGTPSVAEWIGRRLALGDITEVGIDGMVSPAASVEALKKQLRSQGGLTLRTNFDALSAIWKNRPEVPLGIIDIHPLEYAGEECASKLKRIRKALKEVNAGGMLVSALDDIAWTLNLRGCDVHCCPVFVAYLLITESGTTLFTDLRKVTADTAGYLKANGIGVREYGDVTKALAAYDGYSILMDANETSYTLYNIVKCREKINMPSPIPSMKAVKNAAETEGMRRAMLRDGVAMVKFLRWLKPAVERGGETEMSIDRKLTALRAEQELFRDISFDTIAGYADHGAIVHYEATPETDKVLKPEGLLLLDSGAQYLDGTTDITRTIALGALTDEMRKVYTLVLKGHIRLSTAKFPQGATGTQIDALARIDMWSEGMNYLHGTGHGVGSYLNVHEGPQQLRMEWRPAPLQPGMTITNEPGLYLEGRFGVRTENTMLIVPYKETEFGRFLQLEPLTLCPIDTAPIIISMLTDEEMEWLNTYHATVREKLSPLLSADEADWLEEATKPLCR
ncbi:MAG: M24 family metallopeptidase [Prevotella sp.]